MVFGADTFLYLMKKIKLIICCLVTLGVCRYIYSSLIGKRVSYKRAVCLSSPNPVLRNLWVSDSWALSTTSAWFSRLCHWISRDQH